MTRWADHCEVNFRHLQLLMTAELSRVDGRAEAALDDYDAAIDKARESGFLRDEATALERAARHLLVLGRTRSAEGYLRGAHQLYSRWGASRKVWQLEKEFPVVCEFNSTAMSLSGQSLRDLDLASIMKASREISGEMVLDQLLKKTMAILLENAGGQWGCLVVRDEGRYVVETAMLSDRILPVSTVPEASMLHDHSGNRIALPMTLMSQVLHHGNAVVLDDATGEGAFVNDPYVLHHRPLSVLCVPVQWGRLKAVVYMENNLLSAVFTEARVEIIKLLAAQASVAIENARLYEQLQEHSHTLEDKVAERTVELEQLNQELLLKADRDSLTGVANRRRGDAHLQETWRRLRRERLPLSVIMLDVDHFKLFNDNYGHQMGDDCLKKVAARLDEKMHRPADMVSRYGGEEFMLILPNTDEEGAALVGEQVRHAVEDLAIEHAHSTSGNTVTVSVGIATVIPDGESSIKTLVLAADQALYQAKHAGRNRVYSAKNM